MLINVISGSWSTIRSQKWGCRCGQEVGYAWFISLANKFHIFRLYMQGTDLEIADYDGRTALHIAASEGHAHLVRFFLNIAKVYHEPRDR